MVAALGIFQLGIGDLHGEEVARCMAFVTLVIGSLGLVLTNRSMKTSAFRALTRPNRALVFVVIATIAALAVSMSVPWLRGLFGFAPLGLPRLAEAAGGTTVICKRIQSGAVRVAVTGTAIRCPPDLSLLAWLFQEQLS